MLKLIPVIFLILFCLPSFSKTLTIQDLRKEIQKKGANWIANENWVWKSSSDTHKTMMGAALEKDTKEFVFLNNDIGEKGSLPDTLDWRNKNGADWMGPVTNQGQCGSCVAFAAVATLSGQMNIANNWPSLNLNFSEQQLFACGGGACNRGWYSSSAASFLQRTGVADEACLPYTSGSDGKDVACSQACANSSKRSTKIKSSNSVSAGNSANAIKALQYGPLLATMTVYDDFFAYAGGVYQHVTGGVAGGHAITYVGYNNIEKYWIVKNSWGPDWGEQGYFRIKMDDDSAASSFIQLVIDPINGAARITSPDSSTLLNGTKQILLESTLANTTGMRLKVEKNGTAQFFDGIKNEQGLFVASLNTNEFQDGIYDAQAVALVQENGQEKEKLSQYQRMLILNGTPTVKVSVTSPTEGAVLKDRIVAEFSVDASPVPIEKLTFFALGEDGTLKKSSTTNIGKKILLSWRTNLSPNGKYVLWGEGIVGDYKFETAKINVTVDNKPSFN